MPVTKGNLSLRLAAHVAAWVLGSRCMPLVGSAQDLQYWIGSTGLLTRKRHAAATCPTIRDHVC
jgi:hypothetical protein